MAGLTAPATRRACRLPDCEYVLRLRCNHSLSLSGARRACGIALLLCLAAVLPARSDVLVTGQGESLSGDLARIADGILVFRTSLRGQMMMPMSEVKSLSTNTLWAVTQQDGSVHIGRFTPEGLAVNSANGETGHIPLGLAEVAAATLLPVGMEGERKGGENTGWSGNVGVGVRAFDAARDGVAPNATLELRHTGDRSEAALDVDFDPENGKNFPRYFRSQLEFSADTTESWMPFVQGILERDENLALDLRTGLTLGVRYDFDAVADGSLQGLAGLGVTLERWDAAALPGSRNFWTDREVRERDLNLYLELRYSRALWGRSQWDSRMFLLPSITDADHFRAGASSSLVYPVTTRLQLRLDMLLGYDHAPVFAGIDSVDTSLGASIQWDF